MMVDSNSKKSALPHIVPDSGNESKENTSKIASTHENEPIHQTPANTKNSLESSIIPDDITPKRTQKRTGCQSRTFALACSAIIFLTVGVGLLLLVGYFLIYAPTNNHRNATIKVVDHLNNVSVEVENSNEQYNKFKRFITEFGNLKRDENGDITALLLGNQKEEEMNQLELYLMLHQNFLDNREEKDFSSENGKALDELPKTGENLTYLEQITLVREAIREGQQQSEDMQVEIESLKNEAILVKFEEGSNAKSELDKYIDGIESFKRDTDSVYEFYDFSLELSGDYFEELVNILSNDEQVWTSDYPMSYIHSFELSKITVEEMQTRLLAYDETKVPLGLEGIHQSNKQTLEVTITFLNNVIAALNNEDPFALEDAELKFLDDLDASFISFDFSEVSDFWASSDNDTKVSDLLKQKQIAVGKLEDGKKGLKFAF